ncbi:Trm112 family protein [Desulfomarina sp.]
MNRQDIMETINKDLLEILACPQCKGAVKLKEAEGILCEKCKLLYEIRDGIPIMLIDEAKSIEQD